MTMLRKTATAVLAAVGIALAAPALAGSAGGAAQGHGWAGISAAPAAAQVTRVEWRDSRRDGTYRWDDEDWRRDGRYDRRDDRYDRRDDRHDGRVDNRYDRYDDRWDRRHDRWDRRHWRVNHHPYPRRWVGHRVYGPNYVVIRDYGYYGLPAPGYGYYYARNGADVFLVAEATKLIIDAFVLLDATRY